MGRPWEYQRCVDLITDHASPMAVNNISKCRELVDGERPSQRVMRLTHQNSTSTCGQCSIDAIKVQLIPTVVDDAVDHLQFQAQ